MLKVTVKIDGMACGMCEAHVNDVVRKHFDVKKITSSHSKGIAEIIMESEPDEAKLREVISATGYKVLDIKTEEHRKKGFLGLF